MFVHMTNEISIYLIPGFEDSLFQLVRDLELAAILVELAHKDPPQVFHWIEVGLQDGQSRILLDCERRLAVITATVLTDDLHWEASGLEAGVWSWFCNGWLFNVTFLPQLETLPKISPENVSKDSSEWKGTHSNSYSVIVLSNRRWQERIGIIPNRCEIKYPLL